MSDATSEPPLCPTCGQPASTDLAGPEPGWECRNEACAEFGQQIRPQDPYVGEPDPRGPSDLP